MQPEVIIGNHQERILIPEHWLTAIERCAPKAVQLCLAKQIGGDSPLTLLATIEVALVDDAMIDQVHRDFMAIDGPTDVITFHHGEIVISAETAQRQAEEYQEPAPREILRYFIHGLLHLAGHDDQDETSRTHMERAQESIVNELWTRELIKDLKTA